MGILDNVIILSLIVLSFISGKYISDSYHQKIEDELRYLIKLSVAKEGVGYVAPPPKRRVPIGQDFMDRLKENGKAVQQIPNT